MTRNSDRLLSWSCAFLFAAAFPAAAIAEPLSVRVDTGVAAGRDVNIGGDVIIRVPEYSPKLVQRLVVEPLRAALEALSSNCRPGEYRAKSTEPCCPKGESSVNGHCCRVGEAYRDEACVPLSDEETCASGDGAVCVTLARRALDALAPGPALEYLRRPCAAGMAEACGLSARISFNWLRDQDVVACTQAAEACRQGDALGCGVMGVAMLEKRCGQPPPLPTDIMLARGCREVDASFCGAFALLWGEGKTTLPAAEAEAIARGACPLDSTTPAGCVALGMVLKERAARGGGAASLVDAARAFEHACAGGDATGCNLAGIAYRFGEGVTKNEQRAFRLFMDACEKQDGTACDAIGGMYEHAVLVREDQRQAKSNYDMACRLGVRAGCEHARTLGSGPSASITIVSSSVAAAGLIAGAVLGAVAVSNSDTHATYDETKLARTTAVASDVAFGCSLAAAVVLVWNLVGRGSSSAKPEAVEVSVSPHELGARGRF